MPFCSLFLCRLGGFCVTALQTFSCVLSFRMSRAGLPTSSPVHIRCLLRLCQIRLMSPRPHIDFSHTVWLLALLRYSPESVYVCLRVCMCVLAYVSISMACFHEQWGARLMLLLQGISLQVVRLKGRQPISDELICF